MKAIVCELCGGNDLVKQGQFFVCQHCGTKYEPESAKKLVVEYKGTNTENLKTIARQAVDTKDYKKAIKYYEQVLLVDPDNWESFYYLSLSEACIGTLGTALDGFNACFNVVFPLIKKRCHTLEERVEAAQLVAAQSLYYYKDTFAENCRVHVPPSFVGCNDNLMHEVASWSQKIIEGLLACGKGTRLVLDEGETSEELDEITMACYETALLLYRFDIAMLPYQFENVVQQIADCIWEIDPDYDLSDEAINKGEPSGNCYVAIAVYGSYDCPQVWTLRRFRDYELAKSRLGRAFVML